MTGSSCNVENARKPLKDEEVSNPAVAWANERLFAEAGQGLELLGRRGRRLRREVEVFTDPEAQTRRCWELLYASRSTRRR
jgi:hypothetical protein